MLKVPKSLALLEDQLIRLRPKISANTKVIAAGMTRSIHNSTLRLFDDILGPTRTSLARIKARLILATIDMHREVPQSPWPCSYEIPDLALTLTSHASVFSATKPDIGCLFMLDAIPASENSHTVIDLACGNGTLGIVAALKNPQAKLVFTDESWMAIESAKQNFLGIFGNSREVEFQLSDCLSELKTDTVDLILNNPPFHLQNVISDELP